MHICVVNWCMHMYAYVCMQENGYVTTCWFSVVWICVAIRQYIHMYVCILCVNLIFTYQKRIYRYMCILIFQPTFQPMHLYFYSSIYLPLYPFACVSTDHVTFASSSSLCVAYCAGSIFGRPVTAKGEADRWWQTLSMKQVTWHK